MCGIACIFNIKQQSPELRQKALAMAKIFNIKQQSPELRQKALAMAKRIRHRGPDWSGIYSGGSAILSRSSEWRTAIVLAGQKTDSGCEW